MRCYLVTVVCTLAIAHAHVAAAQSSGPPGRPFRGLFGGSDPDSRQTGGLDFTASIEQVHDDDLSGRSGGSPGSVSQPIVGGASSQASVGLDYTRIGENVDVFADARAGGIYYPDFQDLSGVDYAGEATIRARRSGFQLDATQTAYRSPFYLVAFAPLQYEVPGPESAVVMPDIQVSARDAVKYSTSLDVTQRLTDRTSLSGSAFWEHTQDYTSDRLLERLAGTIQLSRRLTQYLSLAAGYGHTIAEYPDSREYVMQDVVADVNYDRPVSRSRRAYVEFSTGASVLKDERRDERDYYVTGRAGFRRLFGRTWTTTLTYDRGARYVEGFDAPFLSNTLSGLVTGFLSRRVELTFTAAVAKGTVGFTADATGYDQYYGIVTARYALSRLTAIEFQYLNYHYTFEQAPAAPTLPQQFDRQGVRFGLQLWLPLLR